MNIIKYIFKGAVFGIANIIPGVSGGTMALVLGFYERLITAINHISLTTIKIFFNVLRFKKRYIDEFKSELIKIDALFLSTIAIGALTAIVALARLMTYLLIDWHDPTYGFFFGLVLLSTIAPYRLIKKKSLSVFISGIIAIVTVVAVSNAVTGDDLIEKEQKKYEIRMKSQNSGDSSGETEKTNRSASRFVVLFLMGAVSVSAMILPGVSGSFLLLLMGGYFEILQALSNRDLPVIAVFALGCVVGIMVFTRLLTYLLKNWHDQTMASLLGLVIGSLWIIWPFKTSVVVGNETIYLSNCLPDAFGMIEIWTLMAALTGMIIILLFTWYENKGRKIEGQG